MDFSFHRQRKVLQGRRQKEPSPNTGKAIQPTVPIIWNRQNVEPNRHVEMDGIGQWYRSAKDAFEICK